MMLLRVLLGLIVMVEVFFPSSEETEGCIRRSFKLHICFGLEHYFTYSPQGILARLRIILREAAQVKHKVYR